MGERRRAERIATRLGVTLGPTGLSVNGHHGRERIHSGKVGGCATYNLVLNLKTETVDCAQCGATDLVRTQP